MFDDLEERGIRTRNTMTVEVNGRDVTVTRINTRRRPRPQDIDLVRDRKHGHQMLIFKDKKDGTVKLYEPETTWTGQHLENVRRNAKTIKNRFQEMPSLGHYQYIHISGLIDTSAYK